MILATQQQKGWEKMNDVIGKNNVDADTLEFLQKNVLNITDLTRTNKLSEVLNKFAEKETDEIFVVQNHKNKAASAALVDLKHYKKLLKLEEIFEQSIDEYMDHLALERKKDVADIPLRKVLEDDEKMDFEDILQNFDDIELEE